MNNDQKISLLKKAHEELLYLESRINIIQNKIIDSVDDLSYRHDILNDIGDIGNIIGELTNFKIKEIIEKLERNQYDNRGNLFGNNGMEVVNPYNRNNNYIGNNGNGYNFNFRNFPRDLNNFVNNGYNRYNGNNNYNRGNNGFW